MKKILSYLTLMALGFTSMSPVFAENVSHIQPRTVTKKVTISHQKQIRLDVESDLVNMQKDGVNALRDLIAMYSKKDTKESGAMKWSVSFDGSDTKTKVDVNLEKYVSILSYLQGRQEIGAKGTIDVVTTGKRTDYETPPTTKDQYGYPKYNTVDTNLTAKITFDVNAKFIGKDIYVTLTEFKTDRTGTSNEIKDFDESLREIQRYVGKTYKVATQVSDEVGNPAEILKKLEAVFQVLEKQSLFEVAQTRGNIHTLRTKKSTVLALNKAAGMKVNTQLSNKDLHLNAREVLTYKKTSSGGILLAKDKQRNYVQLTKSNGEYTLSAKSSIKNLKNRTREDFQMQMTKNMFTLKNFSSTRYSSTWFDISWKDNQLASKMIVQANKSSNNTNTFEVNGPLDIWGGNMNLKFSGDNKEYGTLALEKQGNTYSFKFGFAIDYLFSKMKIDGSGTSQVEQGNIEISIPETFETIK